MSHITKSMNHGITRSFGALGDIHGDFAAARRAIAAHPEIPFWLCVGDIAAEDPATGLSAARYESLGAPVYWIHGNNDNFDAIAAGDLPADLRHVDNGSVLEIAWPSEDGVQGDRLPLRIAGLGGTFAPTWYETAASELPHPKKGSAKATELADKRRHFVREQVDACLRLRNIDVFLTHEAAKPFRPFPGGRGPDAGKAQINEILAAMKPRLHLFGHHHRFTDREVEGVRSIGLDLVSRSYLVVLTPAFDVELKS